MRVFGVSNFDNNTKVRRINRFNEQKIHYKKDKIQEISFSGEGGQIAGSGLGMLLGVAATFVTGPIGALIVTGLGIAAGGAAGDKIEDAINKNSSNNNPNNNKKH